MLPGVTHPDHLLPSAPLRDPCPPSRYDNTPRRLHRPFHQPSLPGCQLLGDVSAWHWTLRVRNPGVLDPANFIESYRCSEKYDEREPAAAAVAVAGHLVSS